MEFSSESIITLGLCGVITLIIAGCYRYTTKPYADIPTFWIISHLVRHHIPEIISGNILPSEFYFQKLIEASERYRSKGLFLMWLPFPLLVVFTEKATKTFLNEPACMDKTALHNFTEDLFGEGLISSNGENWKKQRKMLNPVFHTDMLRGRISTFNVCAEAAVKDLTKVDDKSHVNIAEHLKFCSFRVLCESILGLKIMNEENKETIRNVMKNLYRMSELVVYRIILPWFRINFIFNLTSYGKEYTQLRDDWSNFTRKVILELKESIASNQQVEEESTDHTANRKSFAHILLDHSLNDPSFTLKHLQDEVKTFIIAGSETTAATMVWCLYLLGLHQDIQEQAYNEVVSVTENFVTYEQLCELKYLECIIMETMRLYPTVPIYARKLKKDVEFEQYLVPKGTSVMFFVYALHRNPDVFPDAERFDPDRFMDGTLEKHPFVYTPFSKGVRNCIDHIYLRIRSSSIPAVAEAAFLRYSGKQFAMMEMKVVLAHILRNFKVTSLKKREDIKLNWLISMTPTQPIFLQITPRQRIN